MFKLMGEKLGYKYKKTWNKDTPTDGVWVQKIPNIVLDEYFPIVALEVASSESPKIIKGSIATLMEVNPMIGILLIQSDDKLRENLKKGMTTTDAEKKVEAEVKSAIQFVGKIHQRIYVWDMERFRKQYEDTLRKKH